MQKSKKQSANIPYLEAQEDGLLMRPMKGWAAEKLDYLERYLNLFITAMQNKSWRALNYIDLFAGPGKCQHEDNDDVHLGSPLLALTAKHAFDHYFFVDLDADNIKALKQRCQYSPCADRIQYFQEDCNVAVHHISEQIERLNRRYIQGQWPCLNLAFLDPEGLELHWHSFVLTLSSITRRWDSKDICLLLLRGLGRRSLTAFLAVEIGAISTIRDRANLECMGNSSGFTSVISVIWDM